VSTARPLICVILALSACGNTQVDNDQATSTTAPLKVSGTITLQRPVPNRTPCAGTEDLEQFRGGAHIIVVRDGEGAVIGEGELDDGVLLPQGSGRYFCEFTYEAILTGPADFYIVEVADWEGPVLSHAALEQDDWTMDFVFD